MYLAAPSAIVATIVWAKGERARMSAPTLAPSSACIELARARDVTVPQASVLYGAGRRSSVLVLSGDVVKARDVRVGLSDDHDVEIRSGLVAGERVVARAGTFLRDGDRDRVRPVPAAPTASDIVPAP